MVQQADVRERFAVLGAEPLTGNVVQVLTYTRSEMLGDTKLDRGAVFDIYCVSPSGERFIVEMQKAKQLYFKDRSVFYATWPIRDQAQRGDGWDFKLTAVYLVGVLDFVFAEDKDDTEVCHRVQLKDQLNRVFYNKLTLIYLEMPKFQKTEEELDTLFDKWLYVLKHLPDLTSRPLKLQERVFSKLLEVAEIGQFNREEMADYENSLKHYRDMKNVIDTAAIEGEAKGIAKGKIEGKIEVARNALAEGYAVSMIAKLTGLSETEIESLR